MRRETERRWLHVLAAPGAERQGEEAVPATRKHLAPGSALQGLFNFLLFSLPLPQVILYFSETLILAVDYQRRKF